MSAITKGVLEASDNEVFENKAYKKRMVMKAMEQERNVNARIVFERKPYYMRIRTKEN